METDFLLLDLPLIVYAGGDAPQTEEVTSPLVSNFVLPPKVCSNLYQAASMDEISQYYLLPGKQEKLILLFMIPPGITPLWTQS